jgi:uncharacterized coiled-coil protein SlyX
MGERTKIDIKERPEATVPVLWKHKSDLLSRAELVLNRDNFYFVDLRDAAAAQRKKLRKPEPYTNIACLIARARPYHVDVRLSKGTRIRFMSARIQTAITELAMRAELPSEAIVFEPLVRKFGVDGIVNDVEDVVIEESERRQRRRTRPTAPPIAIRIQKRTSTSGAGRACQAASWPPPRQQPAANDHLVCATESAEACWRGRRSEKAASDIAKQDREVEEISSVLVELSHVADHMGKELERQTEQLEKMNADADANNARLARTAQTIDDMVEN